MARKIRCEKKLSPKHGEACYFDPRESPRWPLATCSSFSWWSKGLSHSLCRWLSIFHYGKDFIGAIGETSPWFLC